MTNRYQQKQPSYSRKTRSIPEPEPGVNKVEIDKEVPIFQLILGKYLSQNSKKAIWIDSGNQSSTYALSSAGSEELLHRVKIGRAFTGFQHYHLVNRIEEFLEPETEYIVLPNVDQQYKSGNISEKEVIDLFSDLMNKIEALRNARPKMKILYSLNESSPHKINLELQNKTNNYIKIEKTSEGLRHSSKDQEQLLYRKKDSLQTTLSYWKNKPQEKSGTVKVERYGKNKRHL